MKYLLTIISCFAVLTLTAQEVVGEYPYNPDFENDGNVGVEDLMQLLASFGMGFDVDEITIDEVALSEWLQAISQTLIDQQVTIDSLSNILNGLDDGLGFSSPCEGAEFVDYHGHSYGIVEIGNQCWFSENLATLAYNNGAEIDSSNTNFDAFDPATISINSNLQHIIAGESGHYYSYGTVYNTNELCPLGWHVPSFADWIEFADEVTVDLGGYYLKDSTEWFGINSLGFNAKPGGYERINLISPSWDWQYECNNIANSLWDYDYYYELEEYVSSIYLCDGTSGEEFDECQNSLVNFIDSLASVYDFEWNEDLLLVDNSDELWDLAEGSNGPWLASFFVLESCNSIEEAIELFQNGNVYNLEMAETQAQWWIRDEIHSFQGGLYFEPATIGLNHSVEIKGFGNFYYGGPGVNFQVRCIKD